MVDTTKSFTKQVLELTNDFRRENGLKPLQWDPELATAAQKHSDNMGQQDFFSHTGKDGSQPWDRTKAAGDDNNRVGENIAAGQRTPEEVVQGWINSPGHRANMLNPNYEYLGVGYHQEKSDTGNVNYQHYWTQNFGGGGTPPNGTNVSNNSSGNSNNANTPSNNSGTSTENNNSGDNNPSTGPGNNNSPTNSSDDFTKQVLQLTNDFRQENGLKPLEWDPELATAAQKHSDNMGQQDFFSHTGKDGSQPWDRTKAAGDDNNRIGENIAAGQRTPEEVVQGWINSPGHRANMLNPNYEYLGVGYHQEKPDTGRVNYQHYWTQNFGGGGTPPDGINEIGGNDTGKDLLMGQSKNEALAGDFEDGNTAINDTSSGIENYNPESLWRQNKGQNFLDRLDSTLVNEANYDGLGSCQLSPENWMGLHDNFLEGLGQSEDNKFTDFGKHSTSTHLFG